MDVCPRGQIDAQMSFGQQVGEEGGQPLPDMLGRCYQAAGTALEGQAQCGALWIVDIALCEGEDRPVTRQAGDGADLAAVKVNAQGCQRGRVPTVASPVRRRNFGAVPGAGFDDGDEIAGDEDEIVIEDAYEIEQRVIAGHDASGLDAREAGLGQPHELAERGLAEVLLPAGRRGGLPESAG